MEINKIVTDGTVTLTIKGRITAVEAGDFSTKVNEALSESSILRIDFKGISYIASAGLRVLVSTQKKITAAKGKLTLANVNEDVMEVFEVTGLDDILQFE
ncbi:MAG: STAS domain-containing protein [Spirochaetaceae bacterium]|jgi:anti-sigma B factor antagonist|nr:STAS domain-containing protein [Spirochaetaceae bacterium]